MGKILKVFLSLGIISLIVLYIFGGSYILNDMQTENDKLKEGILLYTSKKNDLVDKKDFYFLEQNQLRIQLENELRSAKFKEKQKLIEQNRREEEIRREIARQEEIRQKMKRRKKSRAS